MALIMIHAGEHLAVTYHVLYLFLLGAEYVRWLVERAFEIGAGCGVVSRGAEQSRRALRHALWVCSKPPLRNLSYRLDDACRATRLPEDHLAEFGEAIALLIKRGWQLWAK